MSCVYTFSTLATPPQITFQYNNPQAAAYVPELETTQIHHIIQTGSAKPANIDVSKGTHSLQFCDKFLADLIKQQNLAPFRAPVDPEKDLAKDYYNIIKHPMDLTTLQKLLRTGQICTIAEFKRNLDLIWNNCIEFNGPEHQLSILASQIKDAVDEAWRASVVPEECSALVHLKSLQKLIGSIRSLAPKFITITPRPEFPPPLQPVYRYPAPEIHVKVEEKKKEEKPKETVPNHLQRKQIAEKLSNSPVKQYAEAWKLLKPFANENKERGCFSLDSLPQDILIKLKAIVV